MPFLQGVIGPSNQVIPAPLKPIQISAAQIKTLNSAPLTLIPAPGPGRAILLHSLTIEMNRGSVAFTGGGSIAPVYQGATGTFLTANQMAASDVLGAAGQVTRYLSAANAAGGLSLTPNAAVQLYAGTEFAAGNGTMKAFPSYTIVEL